MGLRIWRELLATLGVIGTLVLVSLVSGVCLSLAVRPAVQTLLDYLFAAVLYIQVPNASGTTLLVSLSGAILFALLNVAVILAASSLFVGKVQKILQQRFHDQVPLGRHARFWIWGPLSLLLVLLLPFAFSEVAKPLVEGPITGMFLKGNEVEWSGYFLSGPLLFVFGFLFVFWAARGLKALMFLKRYPALLAAPWPTLGAHVRDVLDRGSAAPSHVVNLGHGVPPDTDPDVLTRIVELVHELG